MRLRRPDEFSTHPRRLTLRSGRRLWNAAIGNGNDDPPLPPIAALDPGQAQLFSSYLPGLEAGMHTIKIQQVLDTDPKEINRAAIGPPKMLNSTQHFNVIQPEYSLPKDAIHSFYPPEGHADENRILPHVVLHDPLLPWERRGTLKEDSNALNELPWVALLVFPADELKLTNAELNGLMQEQTGIVRMDFQTLAEMNHLATTPVDLASAPTQVADFVFIETTKLQNLLSAYDSAGNIQPYKQPILERYKYLTHVKHVNMKGMASSTGGDDDIGMFSVVVAHQTGPWDNPNTTHMAAHLVSIERLDPTENPNFATTAPRVALCSLFSWTYTVLPALSLNVKDAMEHLSTTMNVLSIDPCASTALIGSRDKVQKRVGYRMQDGYTLASHRVQTGESTVALVRGPFTPTVQNGETLGSHQSTFATDLQVLDKELGIMDISYSLAWQLGKSMAIADMAFCAALTRLRAAVLNSSFKASMKDVLSRSNGKYGTTAEELISSIGKSMDALRDLPETAAKSKPMDPKLRWESKMSHTPNMNFWSKEIREKFAEHSICVARQLSLSTTDHPDQPGEKMLYNEHNTAVSSDWAIVVQWIMNGLFFVGVPASYILPDTSYLPRESLRFFGIDGNWTEAFVDGALSVANHSEGDQDFVRVAIKDAFYNGYLKEMDPILGYQPLVPIFGCLLRSEMVKKFPDLRIQAPRANKNVVRPEILRHEIIADDTMILLFDRTPSSATDPLTSLVFSEPPHQQRFAAADNVGPDANQNEDVVFELSYHQVYTAAYSQWPPLQPTTGDLKFMKTGVCPWFDWQNRTLIFDNFSNQIYTTATHAPAPGYSEVSPSSALMAFQLNDPVIVLTVEILSSDNLVKKAFANASADSKRHRTLTMTKCRNRFHTMEKVEAWRAHRAEMLKNRHKIPHDVRSSHYGPGLARPQYDTHALEKQIALQHSLHSPSPNSRGVYMHNHAPPPRPARSLNYDGSGQAQFAIHVRSRDQLQANIIAQADYASDLLFSVVRPSNPASDAWPLHHIRIEMEVGPSTDKPRLMSSYGGFGGRMLSNMRYNPLVVQYKRKLDKTYSLLVLSLYPRSSAGWSAIGKSQELSFVLSEARITKFEYDTTFTYNFWEYYYNPNNMSSADKARLAAGAPPPIGTLQGPITVTVKGTKGPRP
ncbi:hypothetical protein DPSP01_014260 [Paraphaeosphaeria sporulosa]